MTTLINNVMSWPTWGIVILAVVLFGAALAVSGLIARAMAWSCANPYCNNSLAHADYTSMYCWDCRHLDHALTTDPDQRHIRTEAAYSGDFSRCKF